MSALHRRVSQRDVPEDYLERRLLLEEFGLLCELARIFFEVGLT
jgi:hypothetical protein